MTNTKTFFEGLTCESLRSSALLVLQLGLAGEVEGYLDVLGIVHTEYVQALAPESFSFQKRNHESKKKIKQYLKMKIMGSTDKFRK